MGLRDDFSQTFANPDGSFTLEWSPLPQWAETSDGSWVPIDTTLSVGTDGRVEPAATALAVSFSDGGDGSGVDEIIYSDRGLIAETKTDNYDLRCLPGGSGSSCLATGSSGFVELAQPIDYRTYTYDGASRLQSTFSSFNVSNDPQDGQGFLTYTTDTQYLGDTIVTSAPPGGSATGVKTDALGRVTADITYAGRHPTGASRTTSYKYLSTGELGVVTGPDQTETAYGYDLYQRQTSITTPDSGTTTVHYNDLDQVSSTTDARGDTLHYAYDDLGRPTTEWAGPVNDGDEIASWSYDQATLGIGLPYESTSYVGGLNGDAYTEQTSAYSPLGQPEKSTLLLPADDQLVTSGAIPTQTIIQQHAYESRDGSLRESTTSPVAGLEATGLVTHYNQSNRPDSYADVWATTYTPQGQISSRTFQTDPQAQTTAFLSDVYQDGTERLYTSIVNDEINGLDAYHTYTYDDAGSLLEDANAWAGQTTSPQYQCYRYDDGYQQLTDAWTPADGDCSSGPGPWSSIGGAAPYWNDYSYDADSGLRSGSRTHAAAGVTTTSYAYGPTTCTGADTASSHPLSQTVTTPPSGSPATRAYACNAAGDTTSRPGSNGPASTQTLDWNQAGRLARLSEPAHGSHPAYTTTNIYDAEGNLLIRRTRTGTGTGARVTSSLYDGPLEVDASSNTDGSSPDNHALLYEAMDGVEVGLQTGYQQTGQRANYYVFPNGEGTVDLTLDHLQSSLPVIQRYSDPFGQVLQQPSTWPDDKTFLNKPTDPNGGLTTIGARDYDASLGAFISPDPLLTPNDPTSLNGYAYADSDPPNSTDPTGLMLRQDPTSQAGSPPQPPQTRQQPGSAPHYLETVTRDASSDRLAIRPSSSKTLASFPGGACGNGPVLEVQECMGSSWYPRLEIWWQKMWNLKIENRVLARLGVTDEREIIPTAAQENKTAEEPTAANGADEGVEGGLNLFKWNHPTSTRPTGWRPGDYMLHLPNQGSAKLNWAQNSSRLRSVMRSGKPIYESYVDSKGNLIPTTGFLNAERNVLINRGWTYDPGAQAWFAP